MKTEEYKLINKEDITSLTFRSEVDIDQPTDLLKALEQATILGNGYHSKMNIYFISDQGPKRVTTTVWATGSKNICLKGGLWVPISHIAKIITE
jgi:hypothetical protein